ncbi:MAG: tetratricopeptide repeat protein [Deltaproteobacteria bacterium]|nr:tetratricopeptide repeat protein [Deltaproteobacteria bacterium]
MGFIAHPPMDESLDTLADIRYLQKRYREGETLLNRALNIWEKNLGPDHPAMALALANLAWFNSAQKNIPRPRTS